MSSYQGPPSVNPYWYYDPHGYQPNVSVPFNTNMSVNTPPHPSLDMYNNNNNNHNHNTSGFADSGYLSRTPTPPTPVGIPSPQPLTMRSDMDKQGNETRMPDKPLCDNKPRLPYVKRTRIQYTLQQLQILEEAFQENHYPEVTTVDALAAMLDVRHEKISIWFQNRRSRFKRQQKPKSSTSSSSSSNEPPKKITQSIPIRSNVPAASYDPSASYYPPYFWPSPIVDNRSAVSYPTNSHAASFYDSNTSPMWNPNNNNAAYLSSTQWHQSSCSTMNLSSSPSSPCSSLLPEHLSSM